MKKTKLILAGCDCGRLYEPEYGCMCQDDEALEIEVLLNHLAKSNKEEDIESVGLRD